MKALLEYFSAIGTNHVTVAETEDSPFRLDILMLPKYLQGYRIPHLSEPRFNIDNTSRT